MLSSNGLLKRSLPVVIQSAGAHRKPRWLPVARSKIYRIPKRPVVSEEERLELQRINNNYKTQMRAIRKFFYDEMVREESSLMSASSEMSLKLETEDWERCMKLNDEWNKQVAAEREVRRSEEFAAHEEYIMKRIEEKDRELQAKIQEASEKIRKQKELSSTFITRETLDDAIDQALASTVDYNFSIDLQGNIQQGRDTPVVQKQIEKNA